jgi:RNA polymerase sigma-70 factor (ECF subfamily)
MGFAQACVLLAMALVSPFPTGSLLPCNMGLAFARESPQRRRVEGRNDTSAEERERGIALEAMRAPLTGFFRRRVAQQDDVLDLVQEVFLRVTNRGVADEIGNLQGYVFRVADSVLADRRRRLTTRHAGDHVELDPERDGEPELGPDRIVEGQDALKTVLAALNAMPERMRTIFVLRRLEGMRYRDIATRLKISVSAVEKDMARAIAQLAEMGDLP